MQITGNQVRNINKLLDECEELYPFLEEKTGLDASLIKEREEQQAALEKSME